MIVLKEASKRYGENGANTLALNSVSFTLPDTGMVFLVGKSGAGKSTLLNALGGLEPLTGGEILYNGKSLSSFSEKDWDHYRKQTVSFCFQKMNVLPPLTVEENVRLNESRYSPERIREILRSVDMEGMEKRKTSTLSGGQQQRVAIARALYRDSPILLCDEPTGSLDSATASQVFVCLKQASSRRLILIVTHDEASAERYGDRIIRLKDGEVIEDKVIRQVEAAPAPRPGKISEAKEPKKRSHLSAKLLARSLFRRPGRLAAAVLLMGLSIGILMPILSMATRDSGAMLLSSIEHENEPYASYAKARASGNKNVSRKMYDSDWKSLFPKKDEALPFYALSSSETESGNAPVANLDYHADTSSYPLSDDELGQAVLTDSSGLCPIDEAKAQKMGFSLVSGTYPTREEEAMITLAEYQVIRRHGWKILDSNASYSPADINTPEAFLKRSPQFRMIWDGSFQETTIVGVLDTHFDGSSYAKLPAEGDGSLRSEMMRATLTPYLLYGPHTALYVSPSYAEKNFASPTTSDLSGESFYLDDFYSPFVSLEKADEGSDSLLSFSVTSKGAYLPMGALATAYEGDAALTLPEGIRHKDYSYCASLGHDFAEVPESEEVASPSFLFDLSASGRESNLSFLAAGNYVEENGLPTGEAYDSFVSWVQKVYDARARQGYEFVDFSSLDETKEGYLKSFYVWELASVSMPEQGFVEDGYDSNPFGGPNGISLTKELAQKIFAANPPAEKTIHFEVNSIFSGKKECLECPPRGDFPRPVPAGKQRGDAPTPTKRPLRRMETLLRGWGQHLLPLGEDPGEEGA